MRFGSLGSCQVWILAALVVLSCTPRAAEDGGFHESQDGAVEEGRDGGLQAPRSYLSVVALNTHSFQEGPDSLQKLARIGEGLAALDADLVSLNEVMSGTFHAYDYGGAQHDGTRLIQDALEAASGVKWYSATFGFAYWDQGEEMSNVVLSRTPILASQRRELTTTDFWPAPGSRRNVAFVRTQVPGLGMVHFFSTHTAGWDSADTVPQIDELKAFVQEKSRGDEQLTIVAGDLNTPSTWAHYQRWIDGPPFRLVDTYAQANPAGFADSTTFEGEHRIDYVLAREGLSLTYDSKLVFTGAAHEGEVLPIVSDHRGVVTRFRLP